MDDVHCGDQHRWSYQKQVTKMEKRETTKEVKQKGRLDDEDSVHFTDWTDPSSLISVDLLPNTRDALSCKKI